MDIEFDTAKDAGNIAKHGVSLALGLAVLEAAIGTEIDARFAYGEERRNCFGLVDGRLFVCTFTMRGDIYRVISVRKASRQEQARWLS
jgi:uncharacterized DUF497 family protein